MTVSNDVTPIGGSRDHLFDVHIIRRGFHKNGKRAHRRFSSYFGTDRQNQNFRQEKESNLETVTLIPSNRVKEQVNYRDNSGGADDHCRMRKDRVRLEQRTELTAE